MKRRSFIVSVVSGFAILSWEKFLKRAQPKDQGVLASLEIHGAPMNADRLEKLMGQIWALPELEQINRLYEKNGHLLNREFTMTSESARWQFQFSSIEAYRSWDSLTEPLIVAEQSPQGIVLVGQAHQNTFWGKNILKTVTYQKS